MSKILLFDAGDTLLHMGVHKVDRFCRLCEEAGVVLPSDTALRLRGAQAAERHFQARQSHPNPWTPAWWQEQFEAGLGEMGLTAQPEALPRFIELISEAVKSPSHVLDPESVPLLEQARASGWKIGLVSNWDGTLETVIEQAGLSRYIDFVGDSHIIGTRKPDPHIFEHVLAALGYEPGDLVVHVGDSYGADVLGAQAAGIIPVLLDALDCEDRPCPHKVRSLKEVLPLCESFSPGS